MERLLPDTPGMMSFADDMGVSRQLMMDALRFLYENAFITYYRTESRHLPTGNFQKSRFSVRILFHYGFIGLPAFRNLPNTKLFDDAKIGAHHGICPLVKPLSDFDKLDELQAKTYRWVCTEFSEALFPEK